MRFGNKKINKLLFCIALTFHYLCQNRREIHELNKEIERYRKQYEEDSKTLKEITSNPKELEKVAREKYLMKQENEDIYIFEEDLKK